MVSSPIWATTGYVAVDDTHELIVVSFKGTHNLSTMLADIDIPPVDVPYCSGCQAFDGIWECWLDAEAVVTTAVNEAVSANPSYKILVSGHSVGAAVATLVTAQFRSSGMSVDMVGHSFSKPSILNILSSHLDRQEHVMRISPITSRTLLLRRG